MSYIEITPQEYQKYKKKWADTVPQDPTVPNASLPASCFKQGTDWVYGYKIAEAIRRDFTSMSTSNTVFTKVVFRFVVDNSDKVRIVLFGIDNISNDPLTPYYLLNEPITQPPVINENKQQIPWEKAKEWTEAWSNELNKGQDLNATLFHVSGLTQGEASKLQNYTFVLTEVDKIAFLAYDKEVNVYFGINKYPKPLDPNVAGRNLISLIVEWNPVEESRADSYYDVSAPCPPCCPGCP